MDDYQLAVAHYRLQFLDLAALGTGNPPNLWKAEYDRVAASGLSAVLFVENSNDGGSARAVRHYDTKQLLSALHARRGELDADYLADLTTPPPFIAQPAGSVIRLGTC